MKPQPPDALHPPGTSSEPKAPSAPAEPGTPAWCKAVPLFVALAHPGCASVPLKAKPFECPPGAVEAMKELGWDRTVRGGRMFELLIDERGPSEGQYLFTVGAPVTGVLMTHSGNRGPEVPPRTLLYGRTYVLEDQETGAGEKQLIAIYDHAEIPGRGRFPVCIVSSQTPIAELKDGTARAFNDQHAHPVLSRWKPTRYR